jgi:hypothetical protein
MNCPGWFDSVSRSNNWRTYSWRGNFKRAHLNPVHGIKPILFFVKESQGNIFRILPRIRILVMNIAQKRLVRIYFDVQTALT